MKCTSPCKHISTLQACTKIGLSVGEAEKLVEQSNGKEVKEKLKETTQRALDHGVIFLCFLSHMHNMLI